MRLCLEMQKAREHATLISEKVDGAARHVRQIELCYPHARTVVARERVRGLEIQDRRDWRRNVPKTLRRKAVRSIPRVGIGGSKLKSWLESHEPQPDQSADDNSFDAAVSA
jgi:hypothetical protein